MNLLYIFSEKKNG